MPRRIPKPHLDGPVIHGEVGEKRVEHGGDVGFRELTSPECDEKACLAARTVAYDDQFFHVRRHLL